MNSWSSPLGGSIKTATRFEMPLCTRSAASSAPAPPESSDTTMMSADATGSFTTSAHPAALRTGSRKERTATIANAANATTTRIGAHHLGRQEIILGFIGLLHESVVSPAGEHRLCSVKMSSPVLAQSRRRRRPVECLLLREERTSNIRCFGRAALRAQGVSVAAAAGRRPRKTRRDHVDRQCDPEHAGGRHRAGGDAQGAAAGVGHSRAEPDRDGTSDGHMVRGAALPRAS
jgi:hypothetical protein